MIALKGTLGYMSFRIVISSVMIALCQMNWERNLVEEMQQAEELGDFIYVPPSGQEEEGEEQFDDAAAAPEVSQPRIWIIIYPKKGYDYMRCS